MIALLLAGSISLALSLLGTRLLIGWLTALKVGQPIREEGPKGHVTKAGTPTMGGIAIVGSAAIGYAVAHVRHGLLFTRTGMLVMALIIAGGAVGLADDWIKVWQERNLGLNKRAKAGGLLVVALAFAIAVVKLTAIHTEVSLTRYNNFSSFHLSKPVWVIWAVLLIVGTTNAVNLTDGLDGLAAGSSLYAFAVFVVIGYWAFRHPNYSVAHALDLAVVASAMVGACAGFLWWNAAPARIFMGDTGALAIGAGLAGLALTLNTQLLLLIIGALFVVETLSVIIQVASFRIFGRRVFRMAPIHHHFELRGWPETTVIIRFWMLAGLCAALALGIYYADFNAHLSMLGKGAE
ncbi:MAG TPA: phospho-N-acetylmuramoyl-pentapeptide-transferase [Acidimicrobiales bacterium]|jgi:phospho-N-acetylmuramoyl-pentapeptide-transferase|nr:phospho-N-acetylmuramoyl-pentapeptide-transferase [Acidimicrobiales bacterium]